MDSNTSSASTAIDGKASAVEDKQPLGSVPQPEVSADDVAVKQGVSRDGEKGDVEGGVREPKDSLALGGGADGGVVKSGFPEDVRGLESWEKRIVDEGAVDAGLVEKNSGLDGGEKLSGLESGVVGGKGVAGSGSGAGSLGDKGVVVDKIDVVDDGEKERALETRVSEGFQVEVPSVVSVVGSDSEVGSGRGSVGADEIVPVLEPGYPTAAPVSPPLSDKTAGLAGDVAKDSDVVAKAVVEPSLTETVNDSNIDDDKSKEGNDAKSKEGDGAKSKEVDDALPKEGDDAKSKEVDDAKSKEGDDAKSKEGDDAKSKEGADDIMKINASASAFSRITKDPASEVLNTDASGDYANSPKKVEITQVPDSEGHNIVGGGGDEGLVNKGEVLNFSDEKFDGREMPINDNDAACFEQFDSVGEVHYRATPELSGLIDEGLGKPISDGDSSVTAAENEKPDLKEFQEGENLISDGHAKIAILGSSETAKQILKDLDEDSPSTSREFSPQMEGQIVSDSDEEAEVIEEEDGKELFDSAALAALLRAATGASDGNATITAPDAARIFSADRPAGLGSSMPSLRPTAARPARSSLFGHLDVADAGEPEMDEEEKKLHDKVEQIRVKFLRLVDRLGHSPEDTVATQVLYRLGLAEGIKHGRQASRAFSLESAKKKALQLEESGQEDLDFSCNILVLGKSGVGKSETINSIFGERLTNTNAFRPSTNCVKEIAGVIGGVKVCFIDTPGLTPSVMDQSYNKRVLSSIKRYTKKCPPDIVLYVDRLDNQTRDFNDLPLLRSITSTLGSSIWFNAIVALTHAASAPPDGSSGTALSYDTFVAQRSHVVQHSIRQAAGDMRLMNPVALVENHPSCRVNRKGQRVLPNGITWKPQLLLLCYSSKTLSEANSILKLQDPNPRKLFGFRVRAPPLPYLLSSLLQSRPHPKLASDQVDNGDSDIDMGDMLDSDKEEEEEEYDQLPPFKPLKKSQIEKLTKEQKKAYYDEYEYRVKLLQKKQWKEEIRRLKEMKRGKESLPPIDAGLGEMADDYDQDGAPAAVPVPLPDMVLPPTFDCENPAFRYRFLEPTSQLLARPVLDSHGWDHDCGYDGVSLEENVALAGRFPCSVAVQITKDKKEFNIHMDSAVAGKLGQNGSSLAGFDIQSIGKQLAYILRSETKFKNLKKNKTAAGISVTFLGENVATGLKVEDHILIGNRVSLAASTGAIRSQSDTAYGANLEAKLREKDYPIGQEVSTLGLSLMKWRGDLALGANLQSQLSIGRNSKMAVRVGLNNKLTGQITVKTSSSEQLYISLIGLLPIAVSIFRSIFPSELVQ